MKTIAFFLANLLFITNAVCQKSPVKWGKVSKEDLTMTEYKADPEAGAMVLGEVGQITFDVSTGEILYKLEYHKRIKIFKKSAFDQGDIEIPYYTPNKFETIKGLKAQVILPDGKKIAVKKIFDEKINDYWSAKKFAFPNLKEGCIIEFKYNKNSNGYFNLEDWYFQGDIPVRLSQLSTVIPEWYNYVSFTQGRRANVTKSSRPTNIRIPGERLHERITYDRTHSNTTHQSFDLIEADLITTVYKMENIPALKVEPHITSMNDYYAKIQFQLKTVQYPGGPIQNVENTWEKVEKELIEHQKFGDQLNKKRFTKKLWTALEPILSEIQNKEEQIASIYKFISSNVIWDETYHFLIEKTLDDAFTNKRANSGELNLMLIAICRQAGIEAHPVLISTRSHGKMLPYYPKIDQFNHVLALTQIDGKNHIFDIGNSLRSYDLLRENSLNYNGWLVLPNRSDWISIVPPVDKEVCMANFELSPGGALVGEIKQSYKGYSAFKERMACYKDPENNNLKKSWTDKYVDIKIDSIQFENQKDLTNPFKTNIYCKIPDAVQTSGDFMYITPVLNAYEENPFKLEKREYAIDMAYGFKNQYILNLTIPDGYIIEELPEAVNLSLPEKGGKFQFFISQKGNKIQLVNKINISQLHYEPEEYPAIKSFYDIIIEKHSEQIVLKKAT